MPQVAFYGPKNAGSAPEIADIIVPALIRSRCDLYNKLLRELHCLNWSINPNESGRFAAVKDMLTEHLRTRLVNLSGKPLDDLDPGDSIDIDCYTQSFRGEAFHCNITETAGCSNWFTTIQRG